MVLAVDVYTTIKTSLRNHKLLIVQSGNRKVFISQRHICKCLGLNKQQTLNAICQSYNSELEHSIVVLAIIKDKSYGNYMKFLNSVLEFIDIDAFPAWIDMILSTDKKQKERLMTTYDDNDDDTADVTEHFPYDSCMRGNGLYKLTDDNVNLLHKYKDKVRNDIEILFNELDDNDSTDLFHQKMNLLDLYQHQPCFELCIKLPEKRSAEYNEYKERKQFVEGINDKFDIFDEEK